MLGTGSLVGNLDDRCVPSLEIRAHIPKPAAALEQRAEGVAQQPCKALSQLEPVQDPVVNLGRNIQFEAHDPLPPGEGLYHAVKGPFYGAARSRSIPRAISKKPVISRRTPGTCAITV